MYDSSNLILNFKNTKPTYDAANIILNFGNGSGGSESACPNTWDSNNNTSFLCLCSNNRGEVTSFVVDCSSVALTFGFIQVFDGSKITSSLTGYTQYVPDVIHGSSVNATLKTSISNVMSVNVHSGSAVSYNIVTTAGLQVDVYSGSNIGFEITPLLNPSMVMSIFGGDNVLFAIANTINMSHSVYSGDIVTGAITLPPAQTLSFNVYYGDNASYTLSTTTSIQTNISIGDNVTFYSSTSQALDVSVYHGSNILSTFTDNPPDELTTIIESGDNVSAQISTTFGLTANSYDGASVLFEMARNEPSTFSVNSYSGSNSVFNFIRDINLSFATYSGSSMGSTVDFRLSWQPTATVTIGSSVGFDIAVTSSLGPCTVSHGQIVTLPTFSTAPKDYIYIGDNVVFELSSDSSLTSSLYDGSSLTTTLKFAESEPLGIFKSYHASSVLANIRALQSYNFQFFIGIESSMIVHTYKSLNVDLNTKNCCPPSIYDILHVDLDKESITHIINDNKDRTNVSASFLTNPTFKVNVSHGATFETRAYPHALDFNVYAGDIVSSRDVYNELHIDMSYGNLVPTGDAARVELNRPPLIIPTMNQISTGENVNFNLSIEQALTATISEGTGAISDIIITGPMRFSVYHGSSLYFNLNYEPKYTSQMTDGTTCSFRFYEEPYIFSHGQSMSVVALTTNYDVQLLEEGCLDNTYLVIGDDGQPIHNDSETMPVEGLPFSHYITGGCY